MMLQQAFQISRQSHSAFASNIHARRQRCRLPSMHIGIWNKSVFSRPRQLQMAARWQQDSSSSSRRSRSQRRKADSQFRFKFNEVDVSVAEDQLWRVAVPFAALFGLAVFVGPLVVGLTISAMAVGAALSAGALAFTTLLLPLIVLSGIGGLLSFGIFATVGAAFVIPKMIFSIVSLVTLGGGLLLGWGGVNWLLGQTTTASNRGSTSSSSLRDQDIIREPAAESSEDEQEFRRVSSELREFDELLARKEEQRRNRQWDSRL